MTDSIALGGGPEFDRIREMLGALGDAAHGIGGDVAELDIPSGEKLVVSTDTSVEGIHFRSDWMSASEIGYRATAAALSDLAAAAAAPVGVLVALTLPASRVSEATELAKGIREACNIVSAKIIGGDLSRGAELSVTVTVLGSAREPLRRIGAKPGDKVYVTGNLGGSALALEYFLRGDEPPATLRDKFVKPVPRIPEAIWLRDNGATSGIDISDGLAGDLAHIAAANSVGIELDAEKIPLVDGSDPWTALASGEEYEIAVTAPTLESVKFKANFRLPLTEIGIVTAERRGTVSILHDGRRKTPPAGFNHFSK
jgi:thiamine-monophosphate kinase